MKFHNILLISLASVLAVGCSDDDKAVDETVTGPTEAKIMSFNVLYADFAYEKPEQSWLSRRQPVLNMLDEQQPDIICFQEPAWHQVYWLDQKLPDYDFVTQCVNGSDTSDGLNNSVFYKKDKYELVEDGQFWLSATPKAVSYPWNTTDKQRRCSKWVHLKDRKTKAHLWVMSTHQNIQVTDADIEARLKSAQLNVDMMKELAGEKAVVVICGDMNAPRVMTDRRGPTLDPYYEWMKGAREEAPDNDPTVKYSGNGFNTAGCGPTWNIDHIFVRNATPLTFRTIDSPDYGVEYISDHYPIVSTIKF